MSDDWRDHVPLPTGPKDTYMIATWSPSATEAQQAAIVFGEIWGEYYAALIAAAESRGRIAGFAKAIALLRDEVERLDDRYIGWRALRTAADYLAAHQPTPTTEETTT